MSQMSQSDATPADPPNDSPCDERESVLRKLLQLQDDQQRMVAYEIHDGLIQQVIGAKMHAEALLAQLQGGRRPDTDQLKQVVSLLERAVEDGRRLIGQLRRVPPSPGGWVGAVRQWADELAQRETFTLQVDDQLPPDAQWVADSPSGGHLLRMVREAVTNAMRHSGTPHARLHLRLQGGELCVDIADDGDGFDTKRVPAGHYGLEAMRQRALLLGGRLAVHSAPGRGTRVEIRVPLALPSTGTAPVAGETQQ